MRLTKKAIKLESVLQIIPQSFTSPYLFLRTWETECEDNHWSLQEEGWWLLSFLQKLSRGEEGSKKLTHRDEDAIKKGKPGGSLKEYADSFISRSSQVNGCTWHISLEFGGLGGRSKDIETGGCFAFENFSKARGLSEQSEPELE